MVGWLIREIIAGLRKMKYRQLDKVEQTGVVTGTESPEVCWLYARLCENTADSVVRELFGQGTIGDDTGTRRGHRVCFQTVIMIIISECHRFERKLNELNGDSCRRVVDTGR